MKVLVIGGSGLFGKKLRDVLEENNFDVYVTYNQTPPVKKDKSYKLDITQKKDLDFIFKKINPDLIVHSAAFTNVDECERNKYLAYIINARATTNIAESGKKIKSKLIYISTDYVFDGEKGFYQEDEKTGPINYYGITKLKGEKAVKIICNNFIIARTSVIFGNNIGNSATWMIDKIKKGREVNIVIDQYVSPTLNVDLAEQIVSLIEKDATGIFHTAGAERISRYDFAMVIADVFNLNKSLITPVKTVDMNWLALRPKDSSLNVTKISNLKKPFKVKKAVSLLKEEISGG